MAVLVLVGGNPGTGKTTIGEAVAKAIQSAWIDNDHLNPLMDGALTLSGGMAQQYDSPHYKQLRPAMYETAKTLVRVQLQMGLSVVWSAPMQGEFLKDNSFLAEMGRIAATAKAAFLPVWLWAPQDATKKRLADRGYGKDQGKLGNWTAYAAQIHFGPLPSERARQLVAASISAICVENPQDKKDLACRRVLDAIKLRDSVHR